MTNEQILKKAIEKATPNKDSIWKFFQVLKHFEDKPIAKECFINGFIFSHDFAKDFWGEGDTGGDKCKSCGYNGCYKVWKYHLTKMVIEKEPLKYLERFIK